eukprot:scaffold95725_cov57-Phaeocystis_antarctica.AAC.1
MACTGHADAVHMPRTRTCRAHAVHMPCTCRAHACRACTVHMPCTCHAHAMPCVYRAHAMHMPCTCLLLELLVSVQDVKCAVRARLLREAQPHLVRVRARVRVSARSPAAPG